MRVFPDQAFSILPEKPLMVLRKLAQHNVRYMVIGGYAVRYYALLRPTKDLDLFIDRTETNVARLCQALGDLGASKKSQTILGHLTKPRAQLVWLSIDFFSSLQNLEFEVLYRKRVDVVFNSVPITMISLEHLLQCKQLAMKDPYRSAKEIEADAADLVKIEAALK
jgi:predicted nucleotidyltransferase